MRLLLGRIRGGYPEAVELAFGPYAKYGTVIKDYKNATMQYDPSEMVGTERTAIRGIGEDNLRSICTSHVERHNLTIRTLMMRFTRLSLGFSKKLENLEAPCAMFLAYYNYVGGPGCLRSPASTAYPPLCPMAWSRTFGALRTCTRMSPPLRLRILPRHYGVAFSCAVRMGPSFQSSLGVSP